MLIRSNGSIHPGFFHVSVGSSSHYFLGIDRDVTFFDPGLSGHVHYLSEHVKACGLRIQNTKNVFFTHLHPERIAGLPYLRSFAPELVTHGTSTMKAQLEDRNFLEEVYKFDCKYSKRFRGCEAKFDLKEFSAKLKIDKTYVESELIDLSEDISLRVIKGDGHSSNSVSFSVNPYGFIIVDETVGYFNGRDLAGPGGDIDLDTAVESIKAIIDHEFSGICFPYYGVATGDLARKHLEAVIQNTSDLKREAAKAHSDGVSDLDIRENIKKAFYTREDSDPVLERVLERSFEGVWQQLTKER